MRKGDVVLIRYTGKSRKEYDLDWDDDPVKELNRKEVKKRFRGIRTGFNLGCKVARVLYEELYSNGEVVVKNITEKVTKMKDTVARMLYEGICSKEKFSKKNYRVNKSASRVNYKKLDNGVQYKEVMDKADRTASRAYYIGLDSRAASKVNGVKMLEVYNLVRGTEVGYYREDNWVQSKFEDQDHRVVKTMFQNVKSDFISDLLKYKSEFEDNFEEEYKVRQCKFDYISADHRGKEIFSGLCEHCN